MLEWFGKTFIDEEIYVGYRDTIGDIVWGGLGSLLAGLLMPVLVARPAPPSRPPPMRPTGPTRTARPPPPTARRRARWPDLGRRRHRRPDERDLMRGLLTELRRRPHGPAELVADGLRVLAVASIVVAGIGWGAKGASSFAVVSVAMLLPRALGVRPGFDIAYCVIALVSTWSSVTDLYGTVTWWDLRCTS